ncbi:hypothetical protein PPERSA_09283 [Pseudocohnilembus persalinus]|uniref:Uncharacterized protein n=1 Tax=Pseudocohnilembus persalinus TaxID=266149 RepID=A0A0V0R544_PSEPJ|nr:hypothetical protein PPERSA_09283 [Pseudocohnilembus persalinus]|eukprot:KRX09613.1 hypothetical protein PPERSA_09283 [Pseudocohnilembus persalinus]
MYSPAKFDSDQKDVLISQLKAEIFELRQNERDFSELSSHLKNLEHRYQILSDEKLRCEHDLRLRNENNLKTISNLKTDIDSLKSGLTEKHIENQEIRAENMALKEISDHRSLDINRLKNELSQLNDYNSRQNQEKMELQEDLAIVKDQKRNALQEIDTLMIKQENLLQRNSEQEKLIRQLEQEQQQNKKQINSHRSKIEQLELELKLKLEQHQQTKGQLQESLEQISGQSQEIVKLQDMVEKYKQESNQYQKQLQNEQSKNHELGNQIVSLEQIIQSRESQIDEQRKEILQIKQAHADAIDINEKAQLDIQQLQRNVDQLQEQNRQLSNELLLFSDQDEQIRQILNRKNRVSELLIKSESVNRTANNTTLRSPHKRTASKY